MKEKKTVQPGSSNSGRAFLLLVFLLATRSSWAQNRPSTPGDSPERLYSAAEDYSVQHWTQRDGLPVNGISALSKDQEGFLWIATRGGLARFDGQNFRLFEASDYPGLSNNRIANTVSGDGFDIFVTEDNHAVYFDSDQFVDLEEPFGIRTQPNYLATVDGYVWIISNDDLYEISRGPVVKKVQINRTSDATAFFRPESAPLMLFKNSVVRLDSSAHATRLILDDNLVPDVVYTVNRDLTGRPVIGTRHGLFVLTKDRFKPVIGLSGEAASSYRTLKTDDYLFVARPDGWSILRNDSLVRKTDNITLPKIKYELTSPHAQLDQSGNALLPTEYTLLLNGRTIFSATSKLSSLLVDSYDTVWIGTEQSGLFRLSRNRVHVTGLAEHIGQNSYGVFGTPDGMWVALLDGNQFALFDHDRVVRSIPMGTPWTIGRGPNGDIWLAGEHLCRITADDCIRDTIPFKAIRAVFADSKGRFWAGGKDGLYVRVAPDSRWTEMRLPEREPLWIRAFLELPNGVILMASYGSGLVIYENGSLRTWDRNSGLMSDYIRALYRDDYGVLYIGTEDHGLVRLEGSLDLPVEEWSLSQIRRVDGLLENTIHSIVEDRRGRLWMNTNQGIFWVSRSDVDSFARGQITSVPRVAFDERDGMLNREGNGGISASGYMGTDGLIRFPTQKGVAVIDPSRSTKYILPSVQLQEFVVDGKHMPIPKSGRIVLPPGKQSLRVLFDAPFFEKPERVEYRYRLLNYSDSWIEAGAVKQAVLTGISPGDYTLELEAGVENDWSDHPTSITVIQLPSFWQTRWFQLLMALLLMAAFVAILRVRTRIIRARNLELEKAVHDRTLELDRKNKKLTTLDDMKTRFFTNVSHELRTPLTLIRGPVSELMDASNLDLSESSRNRVQQIDVGSNRLSRLVDQILDLAAMEANALRLSLVKKSVNEFVRLQVGFFQSAAQDRGITLSFSGYDPEIHADFDPDKMELVLQNLLSNALKYTLSEGRIDVRIAMTDETFSISVEDTGKGIVAADLPRVFDRFYQSDDDESGGSGIGLSVVREISKLHGGTVDVRSEYGEGTCFTVTLPLHQPGTGLSRDPAKGSSSEPIGSADAEPDSREQTILVVEDDVDLRSYLESVLSHIFSVQTASDGNMGMALAREQVPDIVLTDLMMPGMNGHELCDRLKTDRATSHIPVIMLTAKGGTDTVVESLAHGADVYLSKPFSVRELRAYIRSLLENRRRIQDRFREHRRIDLTDPDVNSADVEFIERVRAVLDEKLTDAAFGTDWLAGEMGYSSRQFLRKVEALTGEKPGEMLRRLRLERAASLVRSGTVPIKSLAGDVGYRSDSSFRKAFKQHFGKTPKEYVSSGKTGPTQETLVSEVGPG